MTNESFEEVLDEVSKALLLAERYNLSNEVVSTALVICQQNPDKPIKDVLNESLLNWDL